MILLGKLIQLILKIAALLLLVTFEFTVGHPVLFLTLSVSFLLTARPISRYILFITSFWCLSVVYGISVISAFLIISGIYLGFKYTAHIVDSNIKRFITFVLFALIYIQILVEIPISIWTLVYAGFASCISLLFLVKILFAQYGFLGSKLQARNSFLR